MNTIIDIITFMKIITVTTVIIIVTHLSSLQHHHIHVIDNQHYHLQHFQYPFNIIIFVTVLIVVFIILMYFLLLWKGLFCFSITKG